jgi:hypothetical protein
MPRGFICPITEEACENGSCTRGHCIEQATLEERAASERKAYEAGVVIDQTTLLDLNPDNPVEGTDRNGMAVYFDTATGRWKSRANRNSN